MSNVCVIYNPHNLLSTLVAMVKRDQILTESFVEVVKLIPYDRSNVFNATGIYDHYVIVGVEMREKHLMRLVNSSNGVGAIYAQPNTYLYDVSKIKGLIVHRANDSSEWLTTTVNFEDITSDLKQLLTIIRKYQDFELLSIDDLLSVFVNQEEINNSIQTGNEYEPIYVSSINRPVILTAFQKQLAIVRTIISRNFESRYYGTASNGNNIPTAAVPDNFAGMAMRQISYPFDSFIIYEDLKSCRLWRIVTRYPAIGETIANTMAPFDVWHDGMITYAITALPQIHVTN